MDMNREFPKLFEPKDEVAPVASRLLHFYVYLVTCQVNDGNDREGIFSTEQSARQYIDYCSNQYRRERMKITLLEVLH
jgi:hypothetical protein